MLMHPVSETQFMRMLAQLQTIQYTVITYGIVAALGAFGATTSYLSICQLLRGGDSLRIIDLIPPLFSIAYLVLDGSSYGDQGSWKQDVANACPVTYNANEGLANQDAGIQGYEISCVDLQHLMSDVLFVRTYIVIMALQLVYGIIFAMLWYGSRCVASSENGFRAHVKRHKQWYRIIPKIGLAICILLTAALILGLWLYRTCVDKVEDDREDSEWGIGQVLAPAAWVPSILDIAKWMYGCFRYRGRESILTAMDLAFFLLTTRTIGITEEDERKQSQAQYLGVTASISDTAAPSVLIGGESKAPWV